MEVSGRREPAGSEDANTYIFCDPCDGIKETQNAEHYCTDCNEFLCYGCANAHRKATFSKQHDLLGRDEMPRRKFVVPQENSCAKHGGKTFEYYCCSHEEFCCSVCLNLGHRQCHFEYILDVANKMEANGDVKKLTETVEDITSKLQEIKRASDQNIDDIKNNHMQILKDIKTFRKEINMTLDSLEGNLVREVKSIAEFDASVVGSVSTLCEEMKEKLQNITNDLEYLERYKQRQQLVIMTKIAQNKIRRYQNEVKEMTASTNKTTITNSKFQKDETILRTLQSMKTLGKLENTSTVVVGTLKDETINTTKNIVKKPTTQRAASLLEEIGIKHTHDALECNITGAVLLDSNIMALADESNASVKIIDINLGTIISQIRLLSSPWDITCINQSQVVVTIPRKTCLTYIHVGETLQINQSLNVGGTCMGIYFNSNNDTFVVSFTKPSPPRIKIISKEGPVLNEILVDTNKTPLFTLPLYVTLSADKSTLHVSDYKQNTVTCLSLTGEIRKTVVGVGMREPSGICADSHGNILVADPGSDNVHMVSAKMVLTKPVLREQRPQTIVFCNASERLYVSHGILSSKRSSVSVYRLE